MSETGETHLRSHVAPTLPTSVTFQTNVPVTMRDGVVLSADVYTPNGEGPWPVLLCRTPYDKSVYDMMALAPVKMALKGFIIVLQDTRGRFRSDGEWMPFRHEREDGHDTVEWAARLPGANGRVGMFGASYFGNTQWSAALSQAPSLGAIAPQVTWSDPMDGLFARGGAVEWGTEAFWTMFTGADYLMKQDIPVDKKMSLLGGLLQDFDQVSTKAYQDLPVRHSETLKRYAMPGLGAVRAIENPESIAWCRVAGEHEHVQVPSFNIGGWYDIFLQGTLDNYGAMSQTGREARLVVGPWSHIQYRDPVGEVCFGVMASMLAAPCPPCGTLLDYQAAWFRKHLAGDTEVALPDAPVRIFVMGRNIWRDEQGWPLQRARTVPYFLRADGDLTTDAPAAGEGSTSFTYDPAHPVPTLGGPTFIAPDYPPGPRDQASIEANDDVLVFTSAPLEQDVEVTGRIRMVLHAVSSAPSTDWVARLCDVHPDGKSINLCDGILRVTAGADGIDRHEIDLWSTSNVFLRGHRIRVHVTSSSFPRWDRNLNTGNQDSPRMEEARQTIFHDAKRASFIELPIIDDSNVNAA